MAENATQHVCIQVSELSNFTLSVTIEFLCCSNSECVSTQNKGKRVDQTGTSSLNLDLRVGAIPLPTESAASENIFVAGPLSKADIASTSVDSITTDSVAAHSDSNSPTKTASLSRIQQLIKSKAEKLKSTPSVTSLGKSKPVQLSFGIGKCKLNVGTTDKVKFAVKRIEKKVKLFEDDSDNESNPPLTPAGSSKSSLSTVAASSPAVTTVPDKIAPVTANISQRLSDSTIASVVNVKPIQSPTKKVLSSTVKRQSESEDSCTSSTTILHPLISQAESAHHLVPYPLKNITVQKQSYEADSTIPDANTSAKVTLYSDEEDGDDSKAISSIQVSGNVLAVPPPSETLSSLR